MRSLGMSRLVVKMGRRMKDSGVQWIGEIPGDWDVVSLGRVASIQTGNTPPLQGNEDYYSHGELMWVKPDNLLGFKAISGTKEKINRLGLDKARIVPAFTPLICCIGSVGKFGFSEEAVAYNQQINAVSFNKEKVFWKYGLYFLSSQEEQHLHLSSGNVVRILNSQNQKQIKMVLPPHLAQQKIVEFLDQKVSQIDHIIEKTKESIKEYKGYKQSLITEIVTKGLNPNVEMKDSGVEWIGETPAHWKVLKIKHIAQVNPSKTEIRHLSPEKEVTFIPMERIITTGQVDYSQRNNIKSLIDGYTYFKDGDIIVAKVTPCFENGNMAIVNGMYNGIGFGTTELHVLRCNNRCFNKYMFYYFQSDAFISKGIAEMYGVAGLKRVPTSFILNHKLGVPDYKEQERIVEVLDLKCDKIDNLITQKEELITELEAYKKSLIYEYVTGKKEVI